MAEHIEKQVPYSVGNQWFQKVYYYQAGGVGAPLREELNEITAELAAEEMERLIGKPVNTIVDRNIITTYFLTDGKLAELDAWLGSSPIVNAYFATPTFDANYNGLTALIGIVDAAITAGTISGDAAANTKLYLQGLQGEVRNEE